MNREMQTQVRQLSERLVERMTHYGIDGDAGAVATLEVARQIAVFTEHLVRLNKNLDVAFNIGTGDR